MASTPSICAVVVTWMPDLNRLKQVLSALVVQVDAVMIIDNASASIISDSIISDKHNCHVEIERLPSNKGLAAAQNIGITKANKLGYSHVILFDQDSVPAPNMVAVLLSAELKLLAKGVRVGAVGPSCIDQRNQQRLPFCKITKYGQVIKTYSSSDAGGALFCRADFLISSGSLLRLSVLNKIGLMDESLFIDSIDIEWCYRAENLGYKCFGIFDAELDHRLGDAIISFFGGRFQRHIHCGVRLESMMRNRVILYKKSYIPWRWKQADLLRLIGKFFLFSLFVAPRWSNCKYMFAGIIAGCRNKALKS